MSLFQTTALLATLAASVSAHGYVDGIVSGGTWYDGTSPSWTYQQTKPDTAGWYANNQDNGYVAPDAYADADIICHKGATVGGSPVPVTAGEKIELSWNTWPESHHGPVIDYLAPVSGDFADVDKTALKFFKFNQGGLVDGSSAPGTWASDDLIANNNTWTTTIPTSVAPGKYVLRHEIIALHSAGQEDGAQNYPQCINIEVTSSGSDSPEGTLGTALYKSTAPGILISIYSALSSYTIPGPALYSGSGSSSGSASTGAASSAAPTSAAASSIVATSAVASSAAPSTTAAISTSVAAVSSSAAEYGSLTLTYADSSAASTPVSTANAVASSPAAIATSSCTTTVYHTVTAVETATITGGATAAPYSAIASIATALPSEALTSTIPTALPSGTASPTGSYGAGENGTHWGDRPSKPLPPGYTLKDLLQWVAYLMKQSWSEGKHARDFKSFAAKML